MSRFVRRLTRSLGPTRKCWLSCAISEWYSQDWHILVATGRYRAPLPDWPLRFALSIRSYLHPQLCNHHDWCLSCWEHSSCLVAWWLAVGSDAAAGCDWGLVQGEQIQLSCFVDGRFDSSALSSDFQLHCSFSHCQYQDSVAWFGLVCRQTCFPVDHHSTALPSRTWGSLCTPSSFGASRTSPWFRIYHCIPIACPQMLRLGSISDCADVSCRSDCRTWLSRTRPHAFRFLKVGLLVGRMSTGFWKSGWFLLRLERHLLFWCLYGTSDSLCSRWANFQYRACRTICYNSRILLRLGSFLSQNWLI